MLSQIRYAGPSGHTHAEPPQAAVLLVNLGTPEAPTSQAVRRYLAEFLADPRVIEYPRWLWLPILHGAILQLRPRRSARAYSKIWTAAGSPLRTGSEALTEALGKSLATQRPGPIRVALAMRYGKPSVRDVVIDLQNAGVRRLLLLPLYPQYSATSTGSVIDAMAATLRQMRWPPELRVVNDYHDESGYIDALAARVREHWDSNGRGEHLLLSFHGIPQRYFHAGDPYFCQCHATARLLCERLDISRAHVGVSFQSRVGREPWLEPYTEVILRTLPGQGVRRLDVMCPGFAVDCLETLEEIALRGREAFMASGGTRFDYIPALNQEPGHVSALSQVVLRHTQGWPEFAADYDPGSAAAQQQAARRRAHMLADAHP